jgi:hypothetical protein
MKLSQNRRRIELCMREIIHERGWYFFCATFHSTKTTWEHCLCKCSVKAKDCNIVKSKVFTFTKSKSLSYTFQEKLYLDHLHGLWGMGSVLKEHLSLHNGYETSRRIINLILYLKIIYAGVNRRIFLNYFIQ